MEIIGWVIVAFLVVGICAGGGDSKDTHYDSDAGE